jgi:hypothetical protein
MILFLTKEHRQFMNCSRLFIFAVTLFLSTAPLAGIAAQLPQPLHVTASNLIPLTSSRKEFKIIDGKDQGRLVPLSFQADSTDEKRWKLSFGDYGRISLRTRLGALIMDRLDLFKSNSFIVYEPELHVLPEEIAGAVVRQTGYKMFSAETGNLKRTGRVTHSVKRISRSQFSTPAGLIDGYYIEMEHKMDMEYHSQLLLTVGLGCRLDDGLVYGSAHYKLRKLGGLLTETKSSVAALSQQSIRSVH